MNDCSHRIPVVQLMATPEKIRQEFKEKGISISEWARTRGFTPALVYRVLSGEREATRGQSHRIAVALGLKNGVEADISDLSFEVTRRK